MEAINSFKKLFLEVWNEGIFGLNASEIIIGFIIFLVFYVLRRLFARFIISKLNKLVSKTSTKIDNTVVEVIEGPLKFLPIVLGFFVATSYIELSIEVQNFIDLLNRTLITVFIFWLLHQLVIPFSYIIKNFEDDKNYIYLIFLNHYFLKKNIEEEGKDYKGKLFCPKEDIKCVNLEIL